MNEASTIQSVDEKAKFKVINTIFEAPSINMIGNFTPEAIALMTDSPLYKALLLNKPK